MKVFLEAAVVGAMLAVIMLIANSVYPLKSATSILAVSFVVGVLFHLGCEVTGINKWYCVHGAACSR